jgi:hypothetical protein
MDIILALLLAQATVKVELRKDGAVGLDQLGDRVRKAGKDPLVEVDLEAGTPVEKGLELLRKAYEAGATRFRIGGRSLVLRPKERIPKDAPIGEIVATLCVRKTVAHLRDPKGHIQEAQTGELKGFVEKLDIGGAKTPAERDAFFGRLKDKAAMLKDVMPPGTASSRLECCPGVSFEDVLRGLAALPSPAHFTVLGLGEAEGPERARPAGLDPGTKILDIEK